jgi:phage-related tail protein
LLGIRSRLLFLCHWFSGLRTALGNTTTQAEAVQTAYNSSQQELEELRAAALELCQEVEEGEAQAGSSLASRLRALADTFPSACAAPFIWVSRRPLV